MTTTPRGLRAAGKRLWRSVTRDFDLDDHEAMLLREACRTVDQLDDLQAEVDANGAVVESSQGVRVHPAVVEARQQRLVLAKIMSALGLPKGVVGEVEVAAS
ncbi:P27 family phage terminase small subunit [Mycobacterium celatum]|uniref:Terminase n=1 Tax=Mycobacterium celatum TaxID=28045 RepID=A0A1X1RJZ0_MYCCE|nr:P27 family phage terminase small subunit [Mycobacterium celatum]ORV07918.1 hypothetical protein AWB95_21130 [Mycobacterium celatum]PIB75320.1 terminase [Mycobacterium celatum]